jgi:hypothetical protein
MVYSTHVLVKHLFLLLFVLINPGIRAQQYIWAPDSLSENQPNFAMDRFHDLLRFHDPIMYLAFPVIIPIQERTVPLEDGEGKNGYLAEGQFGYRFVIVQGKYYSYSFLQHTRLTFDVNLVPRLANDYSAPLLPSNNEFGIGLDFLLSPLSRLTEENSKLLWTTLQLHHYSNGQSDSFFTDGFVVRNNYRSGDFSTNFGRIMVNYSIVPKQKSIITFSVGFQQDMDAPGPLARSKELTDYYGDSRIRFGFQWLQKPAIATVNYRNQRTAEDDVVKVEKRRQVGIRTELEYILGELSKFAGDDKRRFGWHTYLTYMPSVTNEVGFLAHIFIGRDYLNIRFDDIVFIGELGVYVKFQPR